jgi:hypothetical protein
MPGSIGTGFADRLPAFVALAGLQRTLSWPLLFHRAGSPNYDADRHDWGLPDRLSRELVADPLRHQEKDLGH